MADSNIRLRDAAGREIPVGTNTVYTEDVKKLYIREVTFNRFINKWSAGVSTRARWPR